MELVLTLLTPPAASALPSLVELPVELPLDAPPALLLVDTSCKPVVASVLELLPPEPAVTLPSELLLDVEPDVELDSVGEPALLSVMPSLPDDVSPHPSHESTSKELKRTLRAASS